MKNPSKSPAAYFPFSPGFSDIGQVLPSRLIDSTEPHWAASLRKEAKSAEQQPNA
jgi:hypothetical protein